MWGLAAFGVVHFIFKNSNKANHWLLRMSFFNKKIFLILIFSGSDKDCFQRSLPGRL
jgi:hypothetical protein